jgi:hypothetical protein
MLQTMTSADTPNAEAENWLHPNAVAPLVGDEAFVGLDARVSDFWSWAYSDLRSNAVRGILAEFLVARAVGADERVRNAWDNFDVLAPDGTRIEVKASAYLQSWPQRAHSRLGFSGLIGREWDEQTGEYAQDRSVRADVFVFCVHTERDPSVYDALDVSKWEFYVAPAEAVRTNGTRSVGIGWVQTNSVGPLSHEQLAAAIAAATRPTV